MDDDETPLVKGALTCQKMEWTRSGVKVPWCKYDALNPRLQGAPKKDGELCGVGTTCERCESKTSGFWVSKGFTACGKEPRWDDGSRCGPSTTCNMCQNGSSMWGDGSHRCGPRVAGTTQAIGLICGYDNNCVAHTDTAEGKQTKCCAGKCALAEKGSGLLWYCPGKRPGAVAPGGARAR